MIRSSCLLLCFMGVVLSQTPSPCSQCSVTANGVCQCTPNPTDHLGTQIGVCNPPPNCEGTGSIQCLATQIAACAGISPQISCTLTPDTSSASCNTNALHFCPVCGGSLSYSSLPECDGCASGYTPTFLQLSTTTDNHYIAAMPLATTPNGMCVSQELAPSTLGLTSFVPMTSTKFKLAIAACFLYTSPDVVSFVVCNSNSTTIPGNGLNQACQQTCHGGCGLSQNQCYWSGSSTTCGCMPALRGPNCQYACPTDSQGNACSLNGNCVLSPFGNGTACACNDGYVGPNCQYRCASECNGISNTCSYPGTGGVSGKVTCHCAFSNIVGSKCQYDCKTNCTIPGGPVHASCSVSRCDTLLCECSGYGQLIYNPATNAFDTCACDAGRGGVHCELDFTHTQCSNGQATGVPTAPVYPVSSCS